MEIVERGTIIDAGNMRGGKRSHCFTSLCRLPGGRVLATFRRGSDKESADGNCLVASSVDGGRHWQVISDSFRPAFTGVPGEVRAAELVPLSDGTLLAFLTWLHRSGGRPLYDSEGDHVAPCRIIQARSRDGGATWSGYEVLDTSPWNYPVLAGSPIRVPRRGWLVPIERQEPEREGGPSLHSAHALLAADGGAFDQVIDVARDPADRLFFYDQRQAVCPRTGRPVAAFWTYDRVSRKDLEIHLSWGDPETLTWEPPFSTGIRGQIAVPVPLPDGRLGLFYVHRHPPGSLRLVMSPDEGRTWDLSKELVVYASGGPKERGMGDREDLSGFWEDMVKWTFGHPAAVLLEDDLVLLAYYAGESERCLSVHWARVRV
jgi:hypothetical protein